MAVLEYVGDTVESARRQVDRVVTPDTRQKAYDAVSAFAQQRPIFFSFLLAQAVFSLLPALLFASFVLGTVSLALVAALIFSLFWTAVAGLALGATLFFTSGLALLAWVWAAGTYFAGSFVYVLLFAGPGGQGSKQEGEEQQRMLSDKWKNIKAKEPDTGGNAALRDLKSEGEL